MSNHDHQLHHNLAIQDPDSGYWSARMNEAGRAALAAWLQQKSAQPVPPPLAGWVESAEYSMECALTSPGSPPTLEMPPAEAASGQAESLPLDRAWFAIEWREA
jgi:hypothetical protein